MAIATGWMPDSAWLAVGEMRREGSGRVKRERKRQETSDEAAVETPRPSCFVAVRKALLAASEEVRHSVVIAVHETEFDVEWRARLSRPSAGSGEGVEHGGAESEIDLDGRGALEAHVRAQVVVPKHGELDAAGEQSEDDLGPLLDVEDLKWPNGYCHRLDDGRGRVRGGRIAA